MTRRTVLLFVVVVSLLALPAAGWAQDGGSVSDGMDSEQDAALTDDDHEPCGDLPWGVETVCDGVGSALAWGVQPVVAGGAQAVLHEMVAFVVEGAGWLLEQVASFLDTSTRPQLTSSWFGRVYRDMTVVAVFGLLPFLVLSIIQGIVRQDPGLLLRATFGYVPLAAIGTAAGVVVVDLLVQLTDLLTAWIGRSLGSDLADFSSGIGESLASLPSGTGGPVAGLAALLAAGVVAFAAFAIWLELLLRQAAIYVAVLFLPLGFMAMVWPATSHWLRRLVQGLVAIILSKFVIVAVMALAAAALGGESVDATGGEAGIPVAAEPGENGGFGVVLAGASMLALAALAPYVLLRLIPVFEAGLSGDLEGTYRRPTAAVSSPTAGHHMLQAVRHRASGGQHGSYATASADGPSGRETATGGSSGSPATSPGLAPRRRQERLRALVSVPARPGVVLDQPSAAGAHPVLRRGRGPSLRRRARWLQALALREASVSACRPRVPSSSRLPRRLRLRMCLESVPRRRCRDGRHRTPLRVRRSR